MVTSCISDALKTLSPRSPLGRGLDFVAALHAAHDASVSVHAAIAGEQNSPGKLGPISPNANRAEPNGSAFADQVVGRSLAPARCEVDDRVHASTNLMRGGEASE